MADDNGSTQSKSIWPIPKFHFSVEWDGTNISFQEVSGLDAESTPIEYRAGDSKNWHPVKMPGLKKYTNITMKKGVFKSDNQYYNWFKEVKQNTFPRVTVVIKLLNEKSDPTMTWTLKNAFPTKISSTDLKGDGNEAAIETIEVAYESMEIENK